MPADKRENVTMELLFETLKAIQNTLARHGEDLRDIKERLGHVETQVRGLVIQYASLSNRMDFRIESIKRRLDLVDG